MAETSSQTSPDLEHHYTVAEIAAKWNVCENTVRNIFRDEPGVLSLGTPSRLMRNRGSKQKYVRRYGVIRIPESVFLRVKQRLLDRRGPDAVVLPVSGGRDLHAS